MSPHVDSSGNIYEDLPGHVEDTEIRVARILFGQDATVGEVTVEDGTPVTVILAATPSDGIVVHSVLVDMEVTQSSSGTVGFDIGTNTDADAFLDDDNAAAGHSSAAILVEDISDMNLPFLAATDIVADTTHHVIQMVLTELSGAGNICTVKGEVHLSFSRLPAGGQKRDTNGNVTHR